MRHRIFAAAAALVALSACSDATRGNIGAMGESAKVECYSGGAIVHSDMSTGRVQGVDSGEGLAYRSEVTGNFVRVYADCIVTVEN